MAFAKSARARPTLLYQDGGLLWNVHCSTLLPSPFASIARTMCGLIQSTRARVPVTATRLDMSKMAEGEWCAWRCSAASVAKMMKPAARTVRFTMVLLVRLAEYSTGFRLRHGLLIERF